MATPKQIAANRANAQKSTGPKTPEGKRRASQNAGKHGVLSAKLLLIDENPSEFALLLDALSQDLHPVGALEMLLVERVAVAIWKQRRLNSAEAAEIEYRRGRQAILMRVHSGLGIPYGQKIDEANLVPLNETENVWRGEYRIALEECEAALPTDSALTLAYLKAHCKQLYSILEEESEEDSQTIEQYLAAFGCTEEDVRAYVKQTIAWVHATLDSYEQREAMARIAQQASASMAIPSNADVMAKYQASLDNELYKSLKALRETQTWRMNMIEVQVGNAE